MKKILFILTLFIGLSSFAQCPTLDVDSSNPYYVLFSSPTEITYDNNITINGLSFTNAGAYQSNGLYYVSWTNTSGTPLDLSAFSITFGTETCNYPEGTLGLQDFDFKDNFPLDEPYEIYELSGRLLARGRTSEQTLQFLPRNVVLVFVIEGYKPMKLLF